MSLGLILFTLMLDKGSKNVALLFLKLAQWVKKSQVDSTSELQLHSKLCKTTNQ